MSKKGKNPLFGIAVLILIVAIVYFFMSTNGTTTQTVGTLITNLPSGQAIFYLPPPPPQIADLSAQFAKTPYYNYFAGIGGSQTQQSTTQSQRNITNQTNHGTDTSTSTTSVVINNVQATSTNSSTINTQVPTVQLGGHLDITGKVSLINPITKISIIPPYTWIMQLTCISEWCSNDNLPTPKGHTDLTGTMFYRLQANVNFIPAGDYIAKITFISEDGNQVELETNYPFRIVQ